MRKVNFFNIYNIQTSCSTRRQPAVIFCLDATWPAFPLQLFCVSAEYAIVFFLRRSAFFFFSLLGRLFLLRPTSVFFLGSNTGREYKIDGRAWASDSAGGGGNDDRDGRRCLERHRESHGAEGCNQGGRGSRPDPLRESSP